MNDFFELRRTFYEKCRTGAAREIDEMMKTIDPSVENNRAIWLAAVYGQIAVVERLLQDDRVDPSAKDNRAFRWAAEQGHLAVIERLLQDVRVDPAAEYNYAIRRAAQNGHLAVVERLLQESCVDPSAVKNEAAVFAAIKGHLDVLDRLLQDDRVDPSVDNNYAVQNAAYRGHVSVVDRLLEDERVDFSVALESTRPEHLKRFECRERLTEICIALQDLGLPAWITMKISKAACARSTLPIHARWRLACTVKHFHNQNNDCSDD